MLDRLLARAFDAYVRLTHPELARRFALGIGRQPAIALPRDYYDLIQWRKVLDRNPLFVTLSDKLAAKDYIAARCPGLALPRVRWIGTSLDQAPAAALSGDVVVKANHGCGMNAFVRDGRCDRAALSALTGQWMATEFGRGDAEWAYGPVARRLFVEEWLDPDAPHLVEINIRAGRGRFGYGSLLLHAKTPRQSLIYLDEAGRRIAAACGDGVAMAELDAVAVPEGYADAVSHALVMSRDIDYARYDFFWAGGRLYGGEITLYPASGYSRVSPELERIVMAAWDVRSAWFMTAPLTGWRARYRDRLVRHLDAGGLPGIAPAAPPAAAPTPT